MFRRNGLVGVCVKCRRSFGHLVSFVRAIRTEQEVQHQGHGGRTDVDIAELVVWRRGQRPVRGKKKRERGWLTSRGHEKGSAVHVQNEWGRRASPRMALHHHHARRTSSEGQHSQGPSLLRSTPKAPCAPWQQSTYRSLPSPVKCGACGRVLHACGRGGGVGRVW